MEIKVQSIKFDADQKLLDFIDKKLGKIDKFYDEIIRTEVNLSLLADHDNKEVRVRVIVPGNEIVVVRNSSTFENAVVECAGVLKELLTKEKEKHLK